MKKIYLLLLILFLIKSLSVSAQQRTPDRDKFDLKAFDASSTLAIDSINSRALQGNWIAYHGRHIGEYDIAWSTGKPKTLQIKGEKYRKTLAGPFYPFEIKKNLIIFYTDEQPDSAYINLITKIELTISFKSGSDFDQYEYKK